PGRGSRPRRGLPSFPAAAGPPACALNAGGYPSCSSPFAFPSTQDSTNHAYIKSTDPAGNVGTATCTWNIDTVAPTVALALPDYSGCPSTAYISWTVTEATSGIASCSCSYPGAGTFPCTNQTSYAATIPASGSSLFQITGTGNAGNTSIVKRDTVTILSCP